MLYSLRSRAVLRAALLGAVLVGLSACGGGGGGSSSPPSNPPAGPPNNSGSSQWDTMVWDSDNWA